RRFWLSATWVMPWHDPTAKSATTQAAAAPRNAVSPPSGGASAGLVQPVARSQVVACERRFGRSGLGAVVVFPAHERRQRHQDRFGASTRLQAEDRPAVVQQVELDVAAAAIELERTLALAI